MTLHKLEAQKIPGLTFEKRRNDKQALLKIDEEVLDVTYSNHSFEFSYDITDLPDIDQNTITRLSAAFALIHGGLQLCHARLLLNSDRLMTVINISDDQISNVKAHERLVHFVYQSVVIKNLFYQQIL